MTVIQFFFFVLTGIIFSVQIKNIWTGENKQNLFTWSLWTILMFFLATNLWLRNGNYLPTAIYTLCNLATTAAIFFRSNGPQSWTRRESTILLLIVISLTVWWQTTTAIATIAITTASLLAGIPSLIDTVKSPKSTSSLVCFGFILVNLCALLLGKEWSIPERFQACVGAGFWISMLIASCPRSNTD